MLFQSAGVRTMVAIKSHRYRCRVESESTKLLRERKGYCMKREKDRKGEPQLQPHPLNNNVTKIVIFDHFANSLGVFCIHFDKEGCL